MYTIHYQKLNHNNNYYITAQINLHSVIVWVVFSKVLLHSAEPFIIAPAAFFLCGSGIAAVYIIKPRDVLYV